MSWINAPSLLDKIFAKDETVDSNIFGNFIAGYTGGKQAAKDEKKEIAAGGEGYSTLERIGKGMTQGAIQANPQLLLRQQEAQNQSVLSALRATDQMAEQTDRTTLAAAQSAWMKGDTGVNPMFQTGPAQSLWQTWKANTELGKKIHEQDTLFTKSLSELDGPGIQAVMEKRGNSVLPSSDAWKELGVQQQRVRADKQYAPTDVTKLLDELDAEEKAGNAERAKILRSRIANLTSGKQMKLEYDDQGRPIFNMTEGNVQSTLGDPTVGMRTKAQESIVGLGKSYDLLNDLSKDIRPEDLGVRGVLGEEVLDRLVAQYAPGVASDERIDNRTRLKAAIQGMVRQISSDTRFSEADRARAEAAAPSSGAMESHPRALQAIKTLKEIFADRARRDAQAVGAPIPDYAMTPDEIKAQFKAGKLDMDRAEQLLRKYHGYK